MNSAKLTGELLAKLSAAHQDEDAALAARLDQLVMNEKWKRYEQQMRAARPVQRDEGPLARRARAWGLWNEMTLIQQKNWGDSVGSSSLAEVAPVPKKKKSYFGTKKHKTGYQRFVSKNFTWVREEMSKWEFVSPEQILSHEVFSELALLWDEADEKCRDAWKNFATRKGPLPERETFVRLLNSARKGRDGSVAPDVQSQAFNLGKARLANEDYMSKHNFPKVLRDAMVAVLQAKPEDPLVFISSFLARARRQARRPVGGPYNA